MSGARTLLLLGSSNLTHRGQGISTADLVGDELRRLQPESWEVHAVPTTMGRRMAEEAEAQLRASPPDFAVLSLSAEPCVYESVLVKVRRRWPTAAKAAASVEAWLRVLAGGPAGLDKRGRGRIYAFAHAVALGVLGGEPRMTVEQSIENTRECLAVLASMESVPVLVRLPVGGAHASDARRRRYEGRLQRLKAGIVEACTAHRVPYVDVAAALQEAGMVAAHGHDRLHLDLNTRKFEARLLARSVLDVAQADRALGETTLA